MLIDGTRIHKYQTKMMFGFLDEEWVEKKTSHLRGIDDTNDENSNDDQSEEQDDSDKEQMD